MPSVSAVSLEFPEQRLGCVTAVCGGPAGEALSQLLRFSRTAQSHRAVDISLQERAASPCTEPASSQMCFQLFFDWRLPLLQRPGSASAAQQQRFDLKSVSFCCLSLCHSLVFIMSFIHVRIYLLLVQFSTLSH